jgi:hypothetical protein
VADFFPFCPADFFPSLLFISSVFFYSLFLRNMVLLWPIFPLFYFNFGRFSQSRFFIFFFHAVDSGRFSFSLVVSLTGQRERVLFSYFWIWKVDFILK